MVLKARAPPFEMVSHSKTSPNPKLTPPAKAGTRPRNENLFRHPAALAGLLLLMVVAAYLPALQAGFIWDDDAYVTRNPMLTDPNGLREIWFSAHTQSQYFPLVYTSFRLEHALWGLNPLGYHLVNIILHGANAVLVWMVLRRLQAPGAWLAAAIFALHPVQVESVAWVTELKNIESLLFYLLAVLAWMKFLDPPGPARSRFYALALLAYLLALFAKTTACTLPVALVLVLWLREGRFRWIRVLQMLPFLVIGLAMGLVTVWWEGHLGNFNQDFDVSLTPLQRLLLAPRALWFYAGKLIWPVNLAFSYPHWEINAAEPWQYLPAAAGLAVAVAVWVWQKKIGRPAIAAMIFFVAALSPMLGFIMEYTFRYTYVADHYQYNASIGLIAVASAILWHWSSRAGLLPAMAVVVLLVLGCLTWRQCGAYRDLETLWRDTVTKNPASWMAHHNLGVELFDRDQLDEALDQYRAAVALHPNGDVEQGDLGLALMEKGMAIEAIPHFEAALKINPKLLQVQNNLALAYGQLGDLNQAVAHFKLALQGTNTPGILMNLGGVYQRQGRLDDAMQCYRQVTAEFPAEVEPWRRLADALSAMDQPGEVIATYRQALSSNPNNVTLLLALGNAYYSQTNYEGAADCFRNALKTDPGNAGLHYNLGLMLGLLGHPEAERQELQTALQLKTDFSAAEQRLQSLPQK